MIPLSRPTREAGMRGLDERTSSLFSYVDLEDRVPAKHPLRMIRRIVNDVLVALDGEFAKIYADSGRPSIPPERLLRALLLQAFYTIRSEIQLMEQLDYNLLYRWLWGSASTSRCGCRRCSRRGMLNASPSPPLCAGHILTRRFGLRALTTLFWIARHDTLPRRALQGVISVVFDVNQYYDRLYVSETNAEP